MWQEEYIMCVDINLVSTDNKREMQKRKVWSSKPQQPVSISVKSLFDIYLILKDTLLHRLDQLSPQPLQRNDKCLRFMHTVKKW